MSDPRSTRFVVRGRYCPTDANPETDAADEVTEVVCATREEAEVELLWRPGGVIEEVEVDG